MQRTHLIFAVSLAALAAAPAAQAALQLAFHPPAQAGGLLGASEAGWALVYMDEPSATRLFLELRKASRYVNNTREEVGHADDPIVFKDKNGAFVPLSSEATLPAGASFDVTFPHEGAAGLYVQADSIQFNTTAAAIGLEAQSRYGCLEDREDSRRVGWLHCPQQDAAALRVQPSPGNATLGFTLHATGVRAVEWHHARVACKDLQGAPCPGGGVRSRTRLDLPGNVNVSNLRHGHDRIETSGIQEAAAQGSAALVLLGGPSPDLTVDGWVRLPLASAPPACTGCMDPDGRTLVAKGRVELLDVRTGPEGTMAAQFSGDLQAARLDEADVDPAWLTGLSAAAPAVAAGILAVGWLLAFLFTREIPPDKVLDHPRRRLLHDTIAQNPGLGFQDLRRATGLASGATTYQLRVLVRTGLVASLREGGRVRFFAGAVGPRDAWRGLAELRNPDSAALLDLLRGNRWATQATLVHLTAAWGWSRSVTQKRLRRLARAGLASVRRRGNQRLYAARAAPP